MMPLCLMMMGGAAVGVVFVARVGARWWCMLAAVGERICRKLLRIGVLSSAPLGAAVVLRSIPPIPLEGMRRSAELECTPCVRHAVGMLLTAAFVAFRRLMPAVLGSIGPSVRCALRAAVRARPGLCFMNTAKG